MRRRVARAPAKTKQVVTGAASEALALLAARRHARAIQRFGYPVTFKARPK
jgi:hypothetical protein